MAIFNDRRTPAAPIEILPPSDITKSSMDKTLARRRTLEAVSARRANVPPRPPTSGGQTSSRVQDAWARRRAAS